MKTLSPAAWCALRARPRSSSPRRLPTFALVAFCLLGQSEFAHAAALDAFKEATVTPAIGAAVPADALFRDEAGRAVRLADYLGRRPLILSPIYYNCPNFCGVSLGALFDTLGSAGLAKAEIVAYSIDPSETPDLAAKSKADHLAEAHADGAHVHFLTGTDTAIKRLSDAVGYHFAWDPQLKQFAHASTLILLTPDGHVSGYLQGLGSTPEALQSALNRAASGQATPPASSFLLLCYHYISSVGQYSGAVRWAMQIAGGLTILAIGGLLGRAFWRERKTGSL